MDRMLSDIGPAGRLGLFLVALGLILLFLARLVPE